MSVSHTADTQADYYPVTYASSAYDDLAPSLYPQGARADSRSHGTRGKSDRASFYPIRPKGSDMGASPITPVANAIGNFLLVVSAIALVGSVSVAIPLSMFLLFFANFD